MFLKASRNNPNVPSTTEHLICGGECVTSDALGIRNAHPPASAPSSPQLRSDVTGAGHALNKLTNFVNMAVTDPRSEQHIVMVQQQQYSGSDSVVNSNASLWRVPSRVASPFEMPSAELNTTTGAATTTVTATAPIVDPPGIAWIGYVSPGRVRELSPFLNSLKKIRSTSIDTASGQPQRNLDFTFFLDGPFEGQGFLCFYTQKDAEDAVRMFPGAILVGQRDPLMQLSIRLSSKEEMQAAKQHYRCNTRQPTPNQPASRGNVSITTAPTTSNNNDLVYWLRGLPFQTQRSDVENFLKGINYVRLDIGVLESGECSGNAFVELNGTECQEAIENLHNTFIPCAAHAAVPALDRPKPRFVEVILSNADRRVEQLNIDRNMIRNHLPHHPRVRVPATRTVTSTTTVAARYPNQFMFHQQQQQQQRSYTQVQAFNGHEFAQPLSYGAATTLPAPQLSTAPYFLVQSTPQVVGILHSTTRSNSHLASPTHLLSPAEALSMMPVQRQEQMRSQSILYPYHNSNNSNSSVQNAQNVNVIQSYPMTYEPTLNSLPMQHQKCMLSSNQLQSYGANCYVFPPHGHP